MKYSKLHLRTVTLVSPAYSEALSPQVDELVRVGTLVERDISEERAYWRQRQAEHQAKANGANKAKGRQSHHHIAVMSGNMEKQLDPLSLPISINNYRCQAVLDTGSTYYLLQESSTETLQSSRGQTFSLANGHVQTPLGKVIWNCTLHGHQYPFTAFVMRDQDLTLPIIFGLEFLLDSEIQIDFKDKTYILSEVSEWKHPFILDESSTTISLHLALPLVQVSSSSLATIKELASRADVLKTQKG